MRRDASPQRAASGRGDATDRHGLCSIQDALRFFLREKGWGSAGSTQPVFDAWRRAAGEALARKARPVRFRAGELVVEVVSAAHLHELRNFRAEELRERANAALAGAGGASSRVGPIARIVFKLKS